jgi:hypothetical protein
MCVSCDSRPQLSRFGNRHQFLKGFAATNAVATGLNLFAPRPASAQSVEMPAGTGGAGRRYVIRGGSVMSIDPEVGDLVKADVLVEGKRISAIAANIDAGDAAVIDATGWIVMPASSIRITINSRPLYEVFSPTASSSRTARRTARSTTTSMFSSRLRRSTGLRTFISASGSDR